MDVLTFQQSGNREHLVFIAFVETSTLGVSSPQSSLPRKKELKECKMDLEFGMCPRELLSILPPEFLGTLRKHFYPLQDEPYRM